MQLVPKTNLEPPKQVPTSEKIILDVGGMKCAGCASAVERQLTQHPGVKTACVNLATEVAVVESEVGAIEPEALAKQLTTAGFPSQPRKASGKIAFDDSAQRQRQEMRAAFQQLAIAGTLLILSGIGHFSSISGVTLPILDNIWFHCGLATIAILIPGRPIILDGWLGWRRNAPNMNTLVGLGTLTAYTASLVALLFPQMGWECFFDEPVMMLGFILLGRTLERQARGRAAAAFRQLLALQPHTARLIPNPNPEKVGISANSIEIPAEQVRVGEWLQILPGDKIPVDGEIRFGQTTIDESMLTGEALPVSKQPGDIVTAGTINQSGAIAIQATHTGQDTTLAHIIALVEAAQTRKAPIQKLADTVAGYFTYGVLTAAVLTFAFWYFFGTHIWPDVTMSTGWELISHHSPLSTDAINRVSIHHSPLSTDAINRVSIHHSPLSTDAINRVSLHHSPLLTSLKLAIAVMVVACPCALGLATPTAILVGTGIGAERGLLIKGGDVLEKAHQLNTVVFDKTGTLTTGNPTVTDCLEISHSPLPNATCSNFGNLRNAVAPPHSLIQLAAAVESGTYHPLAKAIQQEVQRQQLSIPHAVDFNTEPGLGVSAVVEQATVLLGNQDWLSWHGVTVDEIAQQKMQQLATAGKTVVCVAVNGTLAGIIAVQDTLRADAQITVDKLRQMGIRVILLSGDRQEAANAIAKQLGLDSADVIAGVPPSKKAEVIKSLQAGGAGGVLNTQHCVVAMVGDGINDTPALSQADVGIALHSGTDVAMETAEIILMRDRLSDVVESIQLSRATFNKIRQNLFWAFAYNTLGIPLAAGILLPSLSFVLSPSNAAAFMAFSSVSVVTNSLLLRRQTRHP